MDLSNLPQHPDRPLMVEALRAVNENAASYEWACQALPGKAGAPLALGYVRDVLEALEVARVCLERASPDHPGLAEFSEAIRDYEQAKIEILSAHFPESEELRVYSAKKAALEALKEQAEFQKIYGWVLDELPGAAGAKLALGYLSASAERLRAALKALESFDPHHEAIGQVRSALEGNQQSYDRIRRRHFPEESSKAR